MRTVMRRGLCCCREQFVEFEAKKIVGIFSGDDVAVVVSDEVDATIVGRIEDSLDGKYSCSFIVTKVVAGFFIVRFHLLLFLQSGSYRVSALLNGLHMTQSPFSVTIEPGLPRGDISNVTGAFLGGTQKSGMGSVLHVTNFDHSGNQLTKTFGTSLVF